jgi:RND family efflux transporter MFP subunit
MNMAKEQQPSSSTQTGHPETLRRPLAGRLLSAFLTILVIAVGVAVAVWMLKTSPQAKPQPKARSAALVKVQEIVYGPHAIIVSAMGTVGPAREIALKAQVGGRILELSEQFVPGGLFRKGQPLLQIEATDYELTILELTSAVARAEADLQLEQGNQLVAQREYELLGETVSDEEKVLMLREPQRLNLQASLDAARAKLAQAQLNLTRTRVKTPFNAVVLSREVNIGAQVNEATPLATLVGTDEYWIEVAVPVNQLQWIRVPSRGAVQGSMVRIYDQAAWGDGVSQTGRVVRLAADLEEQGRMARLLVSIMDPLGLETGNADQPRLLLGSFVRVEIEGMKLPSVLVVDRRHVHDGNSLWFMNDEDKLEIRSVDIVYRGRDRVLVSGGVDPGERMVVSDLAAAVPGMTLRLQGAVGGKPGRSGQVQESGDAAPQGERSE